MHKTKIAAGSFFGLILLVLGQIIIGTALLEYQQFNRLSIDYDNRTEVVFDTMIPLKTERATYHVNSTYYVMNRVETNNISNPFEYYLFELNLSSQLNSSYVLPQSIQINSSISANFISLQFSDGFFWTVFTENVGYNIRNYSILCFSKDMSYISKRPIPEPAPNADRLADYGITGMTIWNQTLWIMRSGTSGGTESSNDYESITSYSTDTLELLKAYVLNPHIDWFLSLDDHGVAWFSVSYDITSKYDSGSGHWRNLWVRGSGAVFVGFSLQQGKIISVIHDINIHKIMDEFSWFDDEFKNTSIGRGWLDYVNFHITGTKIIVISSISIASPERLGPHLYGLYQYPLKKQVFPITPLGYWFFLTIAGLAILGYLGYMGLVHYRKRNIYT